MWPFALQFISWGRILIDHIYHSLCWYLYYSNTISTRTSVCKITNCRGCQGIWPRRHRHGGWWTKYLSNLRTSSHYSSQVCINYKDLDYLKNECADGRRLGFNGKVLVQIRSGRAFDWKSSHPQQAIHPTQVDVIQSTFVPTSKGISVYLLYGWPLTVELLLFHAEILRAAKILHQMEVAHASQIGAFGLDLEDGGKEMVDAPMLKQVSPFT